MKPGVSHLPQVAPNGAPREFIEAIATASVRTGHAPHSVVLHLRDSSRHGDPRAHPVAEVDRGRRVRRRRASAMS